MGKYSLTPERQLWLRLLPGEKRMFSQRFLGASVHRASQNEQTLSPGYQREGSSLFGRSKLRPIYLQKRLFVLMADPKI